MKTNRLVKMLSAATVIVLTGMSFTTSNNQASVPTQHLLVNQDDTLRIGQNTMTVQVESDQWIMFRYTAAPGSSVPYHVYADHDKIYMVREGELSMKINGKVQAYHPGAVIEIPRGTKHSYLNNSSKNCVIDIVMSPGDIIGQFKEMDAYFGSLKGKPEMAKLSEITGKYGNTSVGPPLTSSELKK